MGRKIKCRDRYVESHQIHIPGRGTEIDSIRIMTGPCGVGGAPHDYVLESVVKDPGFKTYLHFQEGVIPETGHNGITNEALLGVLIDRLECFQFGQFPCMENLIALGHLRAALSALHGRTIVRRSRRVEGQYKP